MASFVQQLIGEISRATQGGYPRFGGGSQGNSPYELSLNSGAPTEEEVNEIPVMAAEPRKGIFGIKGQARDILGLIGDAFLVQGGADPVYAKRRQEERIADALMDYGTDPDKAIGTLAGVPGAAEQARKMRDDRSQEVNRQGTLENARRKTTAEIDEKQLEREGIVLGRVASMMDSVKGDPAAWKLMKNQALLYAAGKGVKLPYDIPDEPSDKFIYREVAPKDKAQLEDTEAYRDATLGLEREKVKETKRKNKAEEKIETIKTAATTAGIYSEAAKRQDDIQNPKKSGSKYGRPSGGGGKPPMNPRKKNDAIVSPDGTRWVSPDGKNWKKD